MAGTELVRQLDRCPVVEPRQERVKIVHVLAPSAWGGVESVVTALASLQQEAGHDVTVCAVLTDPGAGAFVSAVTNRGIRVVHENVAPRAYLRERRFVREVCRAVGAGIVHTHGYRADVVNSGLSRAFPIVSTAHGFTGGGPRNRLYEFLQRRSYRRYDAVAAVSGPLASRLTGIAARRLVTIVNGYGGHGPIVGRDEARSALCIAPQAPAVAWVGRLSYEKAADVMMEAVALLDRPVDCYMAGDGPERSALQERAQQLGITDRVHWLGAVAGVGALLQAFDVIVLSSRTEGTPMILLEAMAAGVPVVSTAVGGVPDMIGPGEGVLVPSEVPEALAAGIQIVLDDPVSSMTRAAHARERLRTAYSGRAWAEKYLELYSDVIDEFNGRVITV